MNRPALAASLLLLAAACGPAPTEAPLAHPAAVQRDEDPTPPPTPPATPPATDTTGRGGGGTIGSGT